MVVALPDPVIMVQSLDVILRAATAKDEQMSFRLSTSRMMLDLDTNANTMKLAKFAKIGLAELESKVIKGDAVTQAMKPHKNPKINALDGVDAKGKGKGKRKGKETEQKKCKFFASDDGCKAGADCTWAHGQLQPADNKCYNCGSKKHKKPECDRPTKKKKKIHLQLHQRRLPIRRLWQHHSRMISLEVRVRFR